MQVEESNASPDAKNHPLAVRMGVIAGVSHNIVIGTIMGSFGIMLASVEQRLGVNAEEASLGMPLVLLGSSVIAPITGVLIAKYSLRLLLLAGALLTVGGFLLLALTQSYALYLVAFGLFFGPALSLAGSVAPATLVTRWFARNRGLALGVVHLPIVIAVLPVALNWYVERNGAVASYMALAVFAAVVMIPLTLLAIDHPPGTQAPPPEALAGRTADGSLSMGQLLSRSTYWALALAGIASMASSVLLGSLLVPMGVSWGFTRGESALLASIMAASGIVGSVLFGWVADRLGGGRSLALIAVDCAILWSLLLLQPPFWAVAAIVGLIGMHGAGAIPTISRGISDSFGPASFSRGFGLYTVIGLPFISGAIVGSAAVYTATGSYAPAITAMVGFFVLAIFCALYAARGSKVDEGVLSPA